MKNKKMLLAGLLLIAAVFLAGCTAPATKAPTAAPETAAPVATDAPAATGASLGETLDAAVESVEQVVQEGKEAVEGVAGDVEKAAEEAGAAAAGVVEDIEMKAQEVLDAVKARLAEQKPILLTIAELALFDGKDGRPAYVAVDGVIYDVTESAAWRNGAHNGFEAGKDLTTEIKEKSPHGVANLERVKEIGRVKLLLTLAELAAFNGKDGQPAYVAVDGVIYDVTQSALWKDGSHNGFEAGRDLTAEIKEKSPHGVAKLANVVEVGLIVE